MTKMETKRILFPVLMMLLMFAVLEIFVRIVMANNALFYKLHGPIQGLDDASQRIQWVRAHRQGPVVVHGFNQYDRELGWGVRAGLRDFKDEDGSIINTNMKGLRGAKDFSYERVPGKARVVMLGDSFTFGDEVSDDQTYVSRLEKMFPRAEFINLGVSGYGHDQILLTWQKEGVRYRPDFVILGFLYYDMERNLRNFRFYSKPKFEVRGNRLKLTNVPVPDPDFFRRTEFFRLKTLDLIHMLWQRVGWWTGINEKKMKFVGRTILKELVESIRASGAVPVFVYFSTEDDFVQYFSASTDREIFFYDVCRENKIDCVSARPAFIDRLKAGEILDTFGHWDPRGHEIAAQTIAKFFDEKGFSERLQSETIEPPVNRKSGEEKDYV